MRIAADRSAMGASTGKRRPEARVFNERNDGFSWLADDTMRSHPDDRLSGGCGGGCGLISDPPGMWSTWPFSHPSDPFNPARSLRVEQGNNAAYSSKRRSKVVIDDGEGQRQEPDVHGIVCCDGTSFLMVGPPGSVDPKDICKCPDGTQQSDKPPCCNEDQNDFVVCCDGTIHPKMPGQPNEQAYQLWCRCPGGDTQLYKRDANGQCCPKDICCVKELCGEIPVVGQWDDPPVVHCWIEYKACPHDGGEAEPHRFEVWQWDFVSKLFGGPIMPPDKKLGDHLVKDMLPRGAGVGPGRPVTLFEKKFACGDSQWQEFTPCDCLSLNVPGYKWANEYSLPAWGPNSNTFVRTVTEYCGLTVDISSVSPWGWDWTDSSLGASGSIGNPLPFPNPAKPTYDRRRALALASEMKAAYIEIPGSCSW